MNCPRRQAAGMTLIEVLVVFAIISLLLALMMPAIQRVREAFARMNCANNMRQIVLAFHHHHNDYGRFPLAYTDPASPAGWHSWTPFLLTYLEEGKRLGEYDFYTPWWIMPNRAIVLERLRVMQCPTTSDPGRIQDKPENPPPNKTGACGDYFTPTGVHPDINNELPPELHFAGDLRGVIGWYSADNKENTFAAILDGTSTSIMLGECAGREDVWRKRVMYPVNYTSTPRVRARGGAWATTDNAYMIGSRAAWDPAFGPIPGALGINNSNEWGHCYYSFHPGGANFAFADGSVRFLTQGTSLWTLGALTTRACGEAIQNLE